MARAWPRRAATRPSGFGILRGARRWRDCKATQAMSGPWPSAPTARTLVSGSGDGTVRLWDTAPLKTRLQARREAEALRPHAERLVEQLWRKKNDPAEVVEALQADQELSEPLHQAALRAVLRRLQPQADAPGNPHDLP